MVWRSSRNERGGRAAAEARAEASSRARQRSDAEGSAKRGAGAVAGAPMRRHGRRQMRSSMTGAHLPDPNSRLSRFEFAAQAAVQVLRHHLPDEMRSIHIGFASAPIAHPKEPGSTQPMLYSVDRRHRTIVMYRVPIQRARGLHVDDEEHRALFIGHCIYRAVCEMLDANPWDLLPGHFEHF